MGALSDIAAQATNTIKRRSSSSAGYQRLQSPVGMEKENLGKSSPHFMTPTYSSSKKPDTKSFSTSASAKPKQGEGSNRWMKSAAKKVGFRTGVETPRSKKEDVARPIKTLNFPDKFATPSRGTTSHSPPLSEETRPVKVSPKDKPLPSPPVIQVASSVSSIASRSLIDVSDLPLRSSSSGSKDHKEDWPILQPKRSASPGTLQEMMRDTGAQLQRQAVFSQKERYPKLSNTFRTVSNEQMPVSKYSASYKTPRDFSFGEATSESKPDEETVPIVGETDSGDDSPGENVDQQTVREDKGDTISSTKQVFDDDPFRDGVYNKSLTSPAKVKKISPSAIPTSAPVTANPAPKLKAAPEPRQNRTSSLRARLSAGQVVKNDQSKVLGFTDFTASQKPTAGTDRKESLRARKETQARRPTTPPVAPSLNKKQSKDSLGRAPAQFVAGSRRPTHVRRPSSRGSLRNEPRVPSPPPASLPPNRPAPARPDSERASAIPVPRKVSSDSSKKAPGLDFARIETKEIPPKSAARGELAMYEDSFPQQIMNDLKATPLRNDTTRLVPFLIDNKDSHALEAIEESPQRPCQLKRLSTNAPEYGPTLRISPAAERFIMGAGLDKENRSLRKKPSKENQSPPLPLKQQTERPSSSQGLSRLGSRFGLMDSKVREKKVKSADLSLSTPKIPDRSADRAKPRRQSNDATVSATNSKASASTSADPFFDALEEPQPGPKEGSVTDKTGTQQRIDSNERLWLSPRAPTKHRNDAAEDFAIGQKVHEEILNTDTPTSNQPRSADAALTEGPEALQINTVSAQDLAGKVDTKSSDTILPVTPRKPTGVVDSHSNKHPLRHSSRQAPPDWSNDKKAPSPPTTDKIPPPTPPKDLRHQHSTGVLRAKNSSHLERNSHKKEHEGSHGSARRDPFKSHQAPISKGNSVLSNLKGLFNKRAPSDNEPAKSTTKAGKPSKGKPTINENGSPFPPPLSEIHPIYRPTLASTNRSKPTATNTTTPRNSTSASTPNIPPPLSTTPGLNSPLPTSVSATTNMAMQILECARLEPSTPQKERLLDLGTIMVEGITSARNAEKAMEEAKQAATRAEVAQAVCQRTLREVGKCVQEWRAANGRG